MSLKIAIVGAGFSGLAVALQLREKSSDHHIFLCDGGNNIAKGIAYSTQNPSHLLNVPAGNMSAYANKPDHFTTWLMNHHEKYRQNSNLAEEFVPRCLYGAYLEKLLQDLLKTANNHFELKKSHVVALEKKPQCYLLTLANGKQFSADYVVLAFGLSIPANLKVMEKHQHIIHNPWDFSLLKPIEKKDDICILGTGLTMIDIVLALEDQHHEGKIHAVSRHGLLPQAHRPFNKNYVLKHTELPHTLTGLVRFVRDKIDDVEKSKDNWRTIIDALRPFTPKIWQAFSSLDKKRFLRHLVAYWDTHRHRIAAPVFNRIQHLQDTGQLSIMAGRIISSSKDDIIVCKHNSERLMIKSKWLINCIGPCTNYQHTNDLLIKSLLKEGLIQCDQFGLGIKVDEKCTVINKNNQLDPHLVAIGNMCKGTFWETTAVPEIRKQAKMIAHNILTT